MVSAPLMKSSAPATTSPADVPTCQQRFQQIRLEYEKGFEENIQGVSSLDSNALHADPVPSSLNHKSEQRASSEDNSSRVSPIHTFEIPVFNGTTDLEEWSSKAQQYFIRYRIPAWSWVSHASSYLSGAALKRFWYVSASRPSLSWAEFLEGLETSFGSDCFDDSHSAWKRLTQPGSRQRIPSVCQIAHQQLQEHILESGNRLTAPPSHVDDLLLLLDLAESLLSRVEQSPSQSMSAALRPVMKGLTAKELLGHSDLDVRVAVASSISELTRITAPQPPYGDDLMKEFFQIVVEAFGQLDVMHDRSYSKRVSILDTVEKVRSCVVMLDLDCDVLILDMFHHFLKTIRDSHPANVFSSMALIMTVVLQESDVISPHLLSCLLKSVEKDNQDVLPIARRLAETVITNCALQLKNSLMDAVRSLGASLADYTEIVASVCKQNSDVMVPNCVNISGECLADASKLSERIVLDTMPGENASITKMFRKEVSVKKNDLPFLYALKLERLFSSTSGSGTHWNYSSVFSAGGYNWKLASNSEVKAEDGKHYLSLFLVLVDVPIPPHSLIEVTLESSILDENHSQCNKSKVVRTSQQSKSKERCPLLVSLESLKCSSSGFLVVEITKVTVHTGENDCLSPEVEDTPPVYSWKIDGFSKLTEGQYTSGPFLFKDHIWHLLLYPDLKREQKFMSVYLILTNASSLPSGVNIDVDFCLELVDQISGKNHSQRFSNTFYCKARGAGWGCNKFVSLDDLRKPSRGFLVNDTCIIRVRFLGCSIR